MVKMGKLLGRRIIKQIPLNNIRYMLIFKNNFRRLKNRNIQRRQVVLIILLIVIRNRYLRLMNLYIMMNKTLIMLLWKKSMSPLMRMKMLIM
jgi:hypothetical protein